MKKIIILTVVFVFAAGILTNYSNPVPQNAFRIKTKGQFWLGGSYPVVGPAKNMMINLKMTANQGNTTGFVSEFDPNGAYVSSGANAEFDAINAILPATWTVKADPIQSMCLNATPTDYSVVAGGSYEFRCLDNISQGLDIDPSTVDISEEGSIGPASIQGHTMKDVGLFVSGVTGTTIVKYYKREFPNQGYTLIGEKPTIGFGEDSKGMFFEMPNHYGEYGPVDYRIVVVERESNDVYLAHGDFTVYYPFQTLGGGNGSF